MLTLLGHIFLLLGLQSILLLLLIFKNTTKRLLLVYAWSPMILTIVYNTAMGWTNIWSPVILAGSYLMIHLMVFNRWAYLTWRKNCETSKLRETPHDHSLVIYTGVLSYVFIIAGAFTILVNVLT